MQADNLSKRPNELFIAARLATRSPVAGSPLARAELAEQVQQWVTTNRRTGCGIDADYIGKLERGYVRWPNAAYRAALREILGADSDAALGFTPPKRAHYDPAGAMDQLSQQVVAGASVEKMRADVAHLVDLDGRHGGDDVLPLALRVFRTAQRDMLKGSSDEARSADTLTAVAEAGEVAGWAAYDADRRDLARPLSLEALHLARLAGDRSMELFVLANLAMLDLSEDQPGEALAIVEHADRRTGRVGALFTVREARALAQRGERARALDTLHRAEVTMGDGIQASDPSWAWWFDLAEMAWHRAQIHADLGDSRSAVNPFREAVETRTEIREAAGITDRSRVVYNDLAHLVDALVSVQAWSDVEELMPGLLALVPDIGSGRTTRLLRGSVRRIKRAGSPPLTVEDQAEELQRLLVPLSKQRSTPQKPGSTQH